MVLAIFPSFGPIPSPQHKLSEPISTQQFHCLQSPECQLRAGQPIYQWLQVCGGRVGEGPGGLGHTLGLMPLYLPFLWAL